MTRTTRDPARTRRRILTAAKKEFAKLGLSGARVDVIAERAKVNKRMIYHYFASKDGLFLAVLEQAYTDIRKAEQTLDLDHLEPIEAIRALVAFTWRYYLRNPEFLRLVNSENLHQGRHLKASKTIREIHSPLERMVADILRRGEESGVFRSNIDPVQLNISIAALGYYYLTNRHTLSILFDRDLGAECALDARLAFISDSVIDSLRS
jgi:AcrR family transcriptional regulator